jgi:hypothetical protein
MSSAAPDCDLQDLSETWAALRAALDALAPCERARVEAAARDGLAPAVAAGSHWDFNAPAYAADAALIQATGDQTTGPERDRLRRALAARWALDLPDRVPTLHLPSEVQAQYPPALRRFASGFADDDGPYDEDHWAKDVAFALGLTVPCGAQVAELAARLGPGEIVRHIRAGQGAGVALSYVRARGWGTWLQSHTEQRYTEEFNPAGWDACYLRIAAILRTRPALRGMIGSAWFYDPPLRDISPRLAYLQDRPLANGAFRVHQGPHPVHTARATETSPTRRKLVESGAYTPRSWIMAWPRSGLLSWADAQIR